VILHDNLSSGNGYKVRLLLAQLGLPFERIEYDIDRGETRTPEFLERINPNGRIPVLETDEGELLAESDAILFYLAEGTPFLPEGRLGRARVLRWMLFEQYSHEPNVATSRYWATHAVEMTEERRLSLTTKRKLGHDVLGVMEGHLGRNDFFVGGALHGGGHRPVRLHPRRPRWRLRPRRLPRLAGSAIPSSAATGTHPHHPRLAPASPKKESRREKGTPHARRRRSVRERGRPRLVVGRFGLRQG
jgi:glutathione S-transferase